MSAILRPNIGEITGTITWIRGEIPITLGNIGIPGHIILAHDAINIEPITIKITPSTEKDSFATTVEIPLANKNIEVKFGKISVVHTKVSLAYTVSNLPLGIAIQLRIRPRQVEGTFSRTNNPQDAVLEIQQLVVNDFDFVFLPSPK